MVLEDRTTKDGDSGTGGGGGRGSGRVKKEEMGYVNDGKHCEKVKISDEGGIR